LYGDEGRPGASGSCSRISRLEEDFYLGIHPVGIKVTLVLVNQVKEYPD